MAGCRRRRRLAGPGAHGRVQATRAEGGDRTDRVARHRLFRVLPAELKQQLFGTLTGNSGATQSGPGAGSVCNTSPANERACDFSRVVLASTEDVWTAQFQGGRLPRYSHSPGPTPAHLVVFEDGVTTGGCGTATSAVGPFYCPRDQKLYIDPSFYEVMEKRLKRRAISRRPTSSPTRSATTCRTSSVRRAQVRGETETRPRCASSCRPTASPASGATPRAPHSPSLTADLREALNAAHAIGDDTLGHSNATSTPTAPAPSACAGSAVASTAATRASATRSG